MNSDWSLEDWLLDAGEKAHQKRLSGEPLSSLETFTREYWLFDMHAVNGEVSQYFCNFDLHHWAALRSSAPLENVPSFGQVIDRIDEVISSAPDPYEAVIASPDIDDWYYHHRLSVIRELHEAAKIIAPEC
ncbi:MAG: hypothetical protein JNL18_14365 [Planctomycetaceae bacterium]|nr:hypothetical protein [Planctomycetaceae bacterium]